MQRFVNLTIEDYSTMTIADYPTMTNEDHSAICLQVNRPWPDLLGITSSLLYYSPA